MPIRGLEGLCAPAPPFPPLRPSLRVATHSDTNEIKILKPEFLNERRLVQTGSLSSLANTRLGVEGTMWLKNLPTDEPFQLATGGVPLTMLSTIDAELAKFRSVSKN